METKKKRKVRTMKPHVAVMDHGQHGETVGSMGSITREEGETQNTPPPNRALSGALSAPALSRTMWFDFSTVEVIQIKKKAHSSPGVMPAVPSMMIQIAILLSCCCCKQ
jgi:hypothetical protein